jgi:hypothetical protein
MGEQPGGRRKEGKNSRNKIAEGIYMPIVTVSMNWLFEYV